jgi:hypothetical protein
MYKREILNITAVFCVNLEKIELIYGKLYINNVQRKLKMNTNNIDNKETAKGAPLTPPSTPRKVCPSQKQEHANAKRPMHRQIPAAPGSTLANAVKRLYAG